MKRVFFFYLAALHVVLGILIFRTDFIPRAMTRLGLMEPGRDFVLAAQRRFHKQMDASVPDGASIFLGDSITHSLAVAAVAPKAINFGIGQQTTGQLLASLPGYKSLPRAGHIYLNIGTNDNLEKPSVLFPKFRAVLEALPRNVPVTWSGLMPRSGLGRLIIAANSEIQKICATRPGCTYVDSFGAMSDANGEPLPGIYHDGTHPVEKGYKLWINAIKTSQMEKLQ